MQRPTLTRRCTETASSSNTLRPSHLLLRATSDYDVPLLKQQNTHTGYARPRLAARSSSSSASSSARSSIFDDSQPKPSHPPYYGYDYDSDTEEEEEEDCSTLDLSSSGFTCMPAQLLAETDCCMGIRSLNMSQNPLSDDSSQSSSYLSEHIVLPNLSSLCLEDCNVTSLEPLCRHLYAPNLRELNISNHRLRGSVPQLQRYFPKLDTLIARNGKFEQLDMDVISALTRIDLSGNRLVDTDGLLGERCRREGTELVL